MKKALFTIGAVAVALAVLIPLNLTGTEEITAMPHVEAADVATEWAARGMEVPVRKDNTLCGSVSNGKNEVIGSDCLGGVDWRNASQEQKIAASVAEMNRIIDVYNAKIARQ